MNAKLLRAGVWIVVGLALWFGYQALTNKTGDLAPPLTGGTWVSEDAGAIPALAEGRPSGWTIYAFFSPT